MWLIWQAYTSKVIVCWGCWWHSSWRTMIFWGIWYWLWISDSWWHLILFQIWWLLDSFRFVGCAQPEKRSKELVGYLLRRIRKQPVKTTPYLLQINGLEKYCLLVYSILVNLFMGYYFFISYHVFSTALSCRFRMKWNSSYCIFPIM